MFNSNSKSLISPSFKAAVPFSLGNSHNSLFATPNGRQGALLGATVGSLISTSFHLFGASNLLRFAATPGGASLIASIFSLVALASTSVDSERQDFKPIP